MKKLRQIAVFIFFGFMLKAQDKDSMIISVDKYLPDCAFHSAKINVQGKYPPYSFQWSNGATGDSVSNLKGGLYMVKIKGSDSTVKDTTVLVGIGDAVCKFSADQSFTPNGDGHHDKWGTNHTNRYPNFLLQVYSRWGEKVFEQKHEYTAWDGTWHGIEVPEGTYYYVFFYEENITSHHEKGTVTIIR